MTKQLKADLMLVVVTLCWGASYYTVDLCLSEIGPLMLNAYRFIFAFAAAMVLAFGSLRRVSAATVKYSALLGVALTAVYIFANYGVMYTSLSNAGFLSCLAVVFTPVLNFIIKRKMPEGKLLFVIILSVVSIALLTLSESLVPALGDILCIMCSIAYAVHILITEAAVNHKDVNAFHLGVYQLAFVGIFNLIFGIIFEKPQIPQSAGVWAALIFLAVFCTGVAFIIQSIAQQYTSASHVGVIFTLEPVFAGAVAFFLAGEVLLPRAYAGAVMLIIGIFIMELDIKKVLRLDSPGK